MRQEGNAKYSGCAAFLLVALATVPLFLLGCSSGKTAQNNSMLRDSCAYSVRKDSTGERASRTTDARLHDSTYRHDSTVVYVMGDSVRTEHWRNLVVRRTETVRQVDTIVRELKTLRVDTLKVRQYVDRWKTKEVEKPLTTWKKVRLFIGDCALLLLLLAAVNIARRKMG